MASCLCLAQLGTGDATATVTSAVQCLQVLVWQEHRGSPGTALLSSAAWSFHFLEEQPLLQEQDIAFAHGAEDSWLTSS